MKHIKPYAGMRSLIRISTLGLGLFLVNGPSVSAQQFQPEITFARQVAPILQEKCQVCHQPDSVAPMSLLTYQDVRRYAPMIREKVATRVMPPWHIDRSVGIQKFKNDRGLTDDQVEIILTWIDEGMPFGDRNELPPPVQLPDPNRWQLAEQFGEPDLIIRSEPYDLPANTEDKWFRPIVETGLTEPRWVRALEMRPSYAAARQVIHHTLAFLEQKEEGITNLASSAQEGVNEAGLFMEWALGKVGEIFPPDAGKLMLPGSRIRWEVHMHPLGRPFDDVVAELGVYFYPKGYVPKNRTILTLFNARGPSGLDIPPGEISMTQQFHVLPAPARFENFQPHMHRRGKAMAMEAIYPDGRQELLSMVSNFQWNWQVNYVYDDPVAPLLPKGTTLVVTGWHDNRPENPNNPDPEQWVGWGDRTIDEMAHAWVGVTYLEQDDFDQQLTKRKAEKSKQGAQESQAEEPEDRLQ